MQPIHATAQLNLRMQPLDRGELFEDPLMEELESQELGEVTGGGTMMQESGEIDYCDIELELSDIERAVPLVCQFLEERGVPRGSKLTYHVGETAHEVPFGRMEGLAIYLNGTDLPDEVYSECDINFVFDEINRLIEGRGAILGHWQGPTETALYMYGTSAAAMREAITPFVAEYPLCQQSRFAQIA